MSDLQCARQSLVFSSLLGAAVSFSTAPLAPVLVFLQLEGMGQGKRQPPQGGLQVATLTSGQNPAAAMYLIWLEVSSCAGLHAGWQKPRAALAAAWGSARSSCDSWAQLCYSTATNLA